MSSRSLIVLMALSFVGLFGLAWSLYPFLMALVLPDGVTTVATSLSEATQHRMFSMLPIAALGPLLLGGARFVAGPASPPQRLALFASMLGCVGVAAAVLWTTFSAPPYPTYVLDGSLAVSLPVTAVPLYEPGLAACGGIALAALFARLLRYLRG
jgi:hypothetical protein